MAGYTSRNFLSLTIPSILGFLSILWFLRKKSSKDKVTPKQEDKGIEHQSNTSIYSPMKIVNQSEANSGQSAEMQLKETESMPEKQHCHFSNGPVTSNSKVNGKVENASRLHENIDSCSLESLTNGWGKDSISLGDSDSVLTNGIKDLSLSNAVSINASFACAISKTCADLNISNGFVKTNGVGNLTENCDGSGTGSLIKSGAVSSLNSKIDSENSHSEDISFKVAKNQDILNGHKEPVCNGSTSKDPDYSKSKSSIEAIFTIEKLLPSDGQKSEVSAIQYINDKMSHSDNLPFTDSIRADTDEHLSQSGESDHSDLSLLSGPHDEIPDEDGHSSSVDNESKTITDTENNISTSNAKDLTLPIAIGLEISSPVLILTASESLTSSLDVATYNEHLSPPIDYVVADVSGEMQSPGAKYCDSLDSNDSGRGASEIQFTLEAEPHLVYMVYEFEILPEDCGRLIGRNGRHVKYINKQTNANIVIKRHPCSNDKKLCAITGTENEINAALKLIRKRFPIEHFPSVTLAQINSIPISTLFSPETLKLSLPEGGVFEALLCSTVSAGHFFLQQPTHPTFHQLPPLTNAMNALYKQTETPMLENPTKGNICAAEIGGGWYRAEVDEVFEQSDECRLKFLDYGGYANVPRISIRKIKCDFMLIPFQATECFLAGVMPIDENGWSREATLAFEQLAQGQLIQGCIVAYSENRVPYLNLYKITGVSSVFINQELVNSGMARGISVLQLE